MANIVARSFLNDESVALLDASEGARNIVEKQKEIGEFKQKQIDARVELESLYRNSSENNKELGEIMSIGFFGKLFKKKEIEAKRAELEGVKRNIDDDINATIQKLDLIEKILNRLNAEFRRCSEELAKVGLTPEDIIAEYNLIKQELAEKALQVSSEQKQSKSASAKKSQSTKMSQIDKFNMRLAKFNQMNAEKQAKESQPE